MNDPLQSFPADPAEWLAPSATEPFIAVSTRVRLARNLAQQPFPGRAAAAERLALYRATCTAAAATLPDPQQLVCLQMSDVGAPQRQLLVERRLASRELAALGAGSGLILAPEGHFAVMVNEEDHLRIQGFAPGLDLPLAFARASGAETRLGARLDYAFDPELGFLTACPSNLGTGMRASVLLHLPALVLGEGLEPVLRAAQHLHVAVRGTFGEGSEALGNFFQVSNQGSLGETEDEILARLERVLQAIVDAERSLRQRLPGERRERLYDQVGRAYGVLRYAHVLTSQDALNHLSWLLLGCDLGLFHRLARGTLLPLLLHVQPAHLQRLAGRTLDERARDLFRARIVRDRLAATEAPPPAPDAPSPDRQA